MFTIIRDTKEKHPWDFTSSSVDEVVDQGLHTGDYTIEGLEHILCIERKKSVAEFATNCTEARFEREIIRMEKFTQRFIICEFSMNDVMAYPMGSTIPKSKWKKIRVRGPYICKRMSEIMVHNHIPIILAGTTFTAIDIATSIMKRVYDKHTAD